jgi:DNA repair exonuclease SbcCD nuclease subunit
MSKTDFSVTLQTEKTTITRDHLHILSDLLIKRDISYVTISYTIGQKLHDIVHPHNLVSFAVTLSDSLKKRNLYVSPLYLIECFCGYQVFKHQHPENIKPPVWHNGVKSSLYRIVPKDEIHHLIELEVEHLQQSECKTEERIERIKDYLTQSGELLRSGTIVHMADLHFDSDDFLTETVKSTEFILEKVKTIEPYLAVIAGDVVHTRQLHDSEGLLKAIEFVSKMAQYCPVFILHGTRSHDGNNLDFLKTIRSVYPVYVSNSPEIVYFDGYSFSSTVTSPPKEINKNHLQIFSLPSGLPKKKDEISQALSLFSKTPKTRYSVLVSHGTVAGATNSSGYTFSNSLDIDYTIEELLTVNADWYLLGHIHKGQKIGDKIFYSGSIVRRASDETEDKGFWVHNLKDKTSEFIIIPTRRLIKIEVSTPEDLQAKIEAIKPSPEDILKVVITIPEDKINSPIEKEIHTILQSSKIGQIKLEKTIIPAHVVRIQGISKVPTLEEKCKKVAALLNIPVTESLFEKIQKAQFFGLS